MRYNRFARVILVILMLFILTSCKTSRQDNLTVSNIHNAVIIQKTTVGNLKKLYGKPYNVIKSKKKAQALYNNLNENEGGINNQLENYNYWDSVKIYNNHSIKFPWKYDSYYEYRGNNLGVKSVYFFVVDDTVTGFMFDDTLTSIRAAKKDKYLRQIID